MKNVHFVHNCSNLHAVQNLMAIFSLILALLLGVPPSPKMGHIANSDVTRAEKCMYNIPLDINQKESLEAE